MVVGHQRWVLVCCGFFGVFFLFFIFYLGFVVVLIYGVVVDYRMWVLVCGGSVVVKKH